MTKWSRFARTSALALALGVGACGPGGATTDAGADAARPDMGTGTDAAETEGGSVDAATADAAMDGGGDAAADAAADARADVRPDGPPTCVGMGATDPAGTYTFAFSAMLIDSTASTEVPHTGFNLDGMTSAMGDTGGCGQADLFSQYDRDQHTPTDCMRGDAMCRGGVDNQLPSLVDEFNMLIGDPMQDIRSGVSGQVAYGRFAIVLRVSNVDDLVSDPDVTVRVYRAFPSYSEPCRAALSDQEYQISADSLRPGATSIDDAVFTMPGSIVNGRLRAQAPAGSVFNIPVPGLQAGEVNFAVRDMRVRFNISASSGSDGNLGGKVNGNELVDELKRLLPILTSTFQGIFDRLVDIREGTTCVDTTRPLVSSRPAMRYGSIGLGLGFSLVRARIADRCPITDRATPGTCSAPRE